ncbi:hypothetical protein EG68_06267 [Paragonimus skrjabini miyazakii]|uniref:Uncharacterized protein n=1 Tax=Paragonimus skrjabini miyazakii TaxID=59628 RepID=A0A8S9YUW9_9TREM|nr:hypothetical protein EG68_06267 [Paragonimus skrjabini miyazakii]
MHFFSNRPGCHGSSLKVSLSVAPTRKRLDCAQVRQVTGEERTDALIAELDVLKLENRGLRIAKTIASKTARKKRKQTRQNCLLKYHFFYFLSVNTLFHLTDTEIDQYEFRLASVDAERVSLDRVLEQLRLQRVNQLQEEVEHWRTLCRERENSLSEVAAVVNSSKLEADNLRESHSAIQDAQWTVDSLVPNCSQCHVAFNVSRCRRVNQLQEEVEHWRTLCRERENSLSEVAAVVNSSKLEADNLRESHSAIQDAQWTVDSLVPNCSQCHVAFNVSRCRQSGPEELPRRCGSAIGVTICYFTDAAPNLEAAAK